MPDISRSKSNYRKCSCFIHLLSNVYVSLQQFSFKTTEQKGKAEKVTLQNTTRLTQRQCCRQQHQNQTQYITSRHDEVGTFGFPLS